jgi:hypothetical protein
LGFYSGPEKITRTFKNLQGTRIACFPDHKEELSFKVLQHQKIAGYIPEESTTKEEPCDVIHLGNILQGVAIPDRYPSDTRRSLV